MEIWEWTLEGPTGATGSWVCSLQLTTCGRGPEGGGRGLELSCGLSASI